MSAKMAGILSRVCVCDWGGGGGGGGGGLTCWEFNLYKGVAYDDIMFWCKIWQNGPSGTSSSEI